MDRFNHSRKTFLTTHWLLTKVFNSGKGTSSEAEITRIVVMIQSQGKGMCHSAIAWRQALVSIEDHFNNLTKPKRLKEVLALRLCLWFTKYMVQECEQKGYGMTPRWSSNDPLRWSSNDEMVKQ
jgi:hypothetical protein